MTISTGSEATAWRPPPLEALASLPKPVEAGEPETATGAREGLDEGTDVDAGEGVADGQALSPLEQLVRARQEGAVHLLRTLITDEEDVDTAAVVLVALGRRAARPLTAALDEGARQGLVRAVATLDRVEAVRRREAVELFSRRLQEEDYSLCGGLDYARQLVEDVAGRHAAEEVLDRMTGGGAVDLIAMFREAPATQVAPFLRHEHPQTIALILSQVDPPEAASLLGQLPAHLQGDVAYRIATMEHVTPSALRHLEASLEASLRDVLGGQAQVGGPKVVAEIVNRTTSDVEKTILDQMDVRDRDIAEAVRNRMFTFDDIARLTDKDLQTVLREVEEKDLVIAMKGAGEELRGKILGNLSERVRTHVSEELEFLGPMRLSEVEEVQLRIVLKVRELEAQGNVTIARGDAERLV